MNSTSHKPAFHWDRDEIESFLPADDFTVRGLTTRDRQSGLGAPLIAVAKKHENHGHHLGDV